MLIVQTAKAVPEPTQIVSGLGSSSQHLGMLSTQTDFATIFQESVGGGLKRMLGLEGMQAILYYIDLASYDDPRRFHEQLSAIFGVGTAPVEAAILQQLHQTLGVRPASRSDDDFVSRVEMARSSFDSTARPEGQRKVTSI
jgi:hypothetical protein